MQFKVHRRTDGLLADGPSGDLHVLLADGADDITRGQILGGDLVRVEPDSHGVVAGTEHLHVTRAGDARQDVLHLQRRVVADVNLVVLIVR